MKETEKSGVGFFRTLWHIRKNIIVISFSGIMIALVFNTITKPVYKSNALVELKLTEGEGNDLKETDHRKIDELRMTECMKIASRTVIEEAALNRGILEKDMGYFEYNNTLAFLVKHTAAKRIKGTNLLQIEVQSNNQQDAPILIDEMINVYNSRLDEFEKKFYKKYRDTVATDLNRVKDSLAADKNKLKALYNEYSYVDDSELLKSELIPLRLELAKNSRKYNTKHPVIIDLKEQIKIIENNLEVLHEKDRINERILKNEEVYHSIEKRISGQMSKKAGYVLGISVVNPPVAPIKPVRPKKALNLLLGGSAGLLLGIFRVVGAGYVRRKRIDVPNEIETVNNKYLKEFAGSKKVLIVDDEYAVTNIIARMLLKKGMFEYEIAIANNGFDAVQQLEIFNPDIIILDIKMPGINGLQLCRKIRSESRHKDVKIIAISGYCDADTKKEIISLGANEFMAKPLDTNQFINCVDAVAC